jgi:hypothetical protein
MLNLLGLIFALDLESRDQSQQTNSNSNPFDLPSFF